jgi:voltage-gated potassium channel
VGALGVIFLLVVLGQSLSESATISRVLATLGWLLWAVFVAGFASGVYVARDQRCFWARNWWQVIFLAVPFLRFVRVISFLRFARVGSVVSAAVRGSRSAGRLLSSRIGWLAAVTAVVVLASSQLLVVAGSYEHYGEALHDAALATVTGEPLPADDAFADVLEVVLATYSVGGFATLAGAIGAYFPGQKASATADTSREQSEVDDGVNLR